MWSADLFSPLHAPLNCYDTFVTSGSLQLQLLTPFATADKCFPTVPSALHAMNPTKGQAASPVSSSAWGQPATSLLFRRNSGNFLSRLYLLFVSAVPTVMGGGAYRSPLTPWTIFTLVLIPRSRRKQQIWPLFLMIPLIETFQPPTPGDKTSAAHLLFRSSLCVSVSDPPPSPAGTNTQ